MASGNAGLDYMGWTQLRDYIETMNLEYTGQTAEEICTALSTEVQQTGMTVWQGSSYVGQGAQNLFPAAQTATEAMQSYVQSGGAVVENSEAAAIQISDEMIANFTAGTSGGTAGLYGVLTASAPAITAGAAPIFGAALGYGLYELAPDFWTEVSQTLLPWAWEDTEVIPVVCDEYGNTYLPKELIASLGVVLNNYISDEDVVTTDIPQYQYLKPPFSVYSSLDIYLDRDYAGLKKGLLKISVNDGYILSVVDGFFACSSTPLTVTLTDSDGNTNTTAPYYGSGTSDVTRNFTYWARMTNGNVFTNIIPAHILPGSYNSLYLSDAIVNGTHSKAPTIEGLEEWQGDPYPENPNTVDIFNGYDAQGNPQYETYQQVAMPIGDNPIYTNNPEIQPSPYTNPEIAPAIEPYISPLPSPNQYPVANPDELPGLTPAEVPAPLPGIVPEPATETVPEPSTDPSTETDTVPQNQPVPQEGTSGGTSPSPSLPLIPLIPLASDASLYHVYNPTQTQLNAFGGWLWQAFTGALFDDISRWFNNPMDAVIGLQEFYGTPNIQGSGTIRCGYLDSNISSDVVGNRYSVINCGSIVVPEYYGNYLDYAPYSQVICYLPFIGFMSLNADDIIGNAVNIKYHVDSYTGSCIAIISVARQGYESIVYQFEGNCSVDVPLTGGQQNALKGAILGGISGAVMGGVAGAAVGAVLGGLSSKNDVQHSGSFSASYGAMGAKIPFIVVRRPVQKQIYNYNESYGFPAHKMVYVGNCRGYLRAREVRVLSTTATNEEKQLIVNALKAGVYVRN